MTFRIVVAAAVAGAAVAGAAWAETPVERGAYLVRGPAACGNCHTPIGPEGHVAGMEMAGGMVEKNPMFTAIAPNLTPAGPVGEWSDAEVARAIREGIRPDGSVIGPPMPIPLYRQMSDADVTAIVAFLRTLPLIENDPGKSVYNIPLPPAYGPPVGQVDAPERGPTAAYGAYLAGPIAHCLECHTPLGPQGRLFETALGQGGFEFRGPWGVAIAKNITSGPDGVGQYSDAELAAMITEGKRPDGSAMLPPMPYPWLARMTPDDLTAVIAYLRTIPPLPDVK